MILNVFSNEFPPLKFPTASEILSNTLELSVVLLLTSLIRLPVLLAISNEPDNEYPSTLFIILNN